VYNLPLGYHVRRKKTDGLVSIYGCAAHEATVGTEGAEKHEFNRPLALSPILHRFVVPITSNDSAKLDATETTASRRKIDDAELRGDARPASNDRVVQLTNPAAGALDTAAAEAEAFLKALDSGGSLAFQTSDDNKQRRKLHKDDPLARTLHGRLSDLAPQLEALARQGAGIFVTVNEVRDGAPRTNDNGRRKGRH